MIRFRLLLLGFFVYGFLCSEAQTKKLDSLKAAFKTASTSRNKITILEALLEQHNSFNSTTTYAYANELKNLAEAEGDTKTGVKANIAIAFYFAAAKKMDTALQILSSQLNKVSTKDGELYLFTLLNHSRLLYRNNQYREALQGLFLTLNTAEKLASPKYQLMAKTGIGWLQLDMKQYNDALGWFHKALNTPGTANYLGEYSALYSNLATTYNTLGKIDSALLYIKKAIDNSRANESLDFLATSLRIYADILLKQKKYVDAEAALKEMVEVRKVSDGSFFVNYDMSLLARFYAQTGQTKKGIALCKSVIDSALASGIITQLYLMYDALAANYKAAGNYKAYGETLEHSKAIQDSLYTLNTGELIAALQSEAELQKKETIIVQQKLDIVQKKVLLYGMLAVVLFIGTIVFLLIKQHNKKQRLKLQLVRADQEKKVHEAEEAERKRIAADLHDSLGAYAASIASNIDQLQHDFSLEELPLLKELQANSQAIVLQLNDTIWVLKKDALSLTNISDRLKVFIQKLSPSYQYIVIDVEEEILTDHLLPPAHAFHLFQIIKEAINNALRHSGCTQIRIKIESGAFWKLTISDDGKGIIHSNSFATKGDGLENMKTRAAQSGWQIEWQHNHPAGTKVVVNSTEN